MKMGGEPTTSTIH